MGRYVIGVDIGGTKTAITLALISKLTKNMIVDDLVSDKLVFPTPIGASSDEAVPLIIEKIKEMLNRNKLENADIKAIGISCGGPVDSRNGVILNPPNLYGWNNVPIVEILSNEFGSVVALQNDANACALAEWKFGAGKGFDNMIFLTMGTGMGAGLILGGRLYNGTDDMAGEIGHVRLAKHGPVGFGKEGSFEGFCSGGGIAQLAATKALEMLQRGETVSYCNSLDELYNISAKSVADCAQKGNKDALEVYQEVGKYLGKGLSILIDVLNPQKIIIGSIFCRSHDLMWETMQHSLEQEAIHTSRISCVVEPAKLQESLGDFAAISVGIYALKNGY